MEESAPAPSSPPADEEMPPVSVAAPAEGESGSGASSPPPGAWAAILSFLDRPQEARQSALASLPSSDLIRLCMEASATALGRLSWYDGAGTAAVSGHPIRNPPPRQLVLRAHPVAKEPPPKAMAPSPAKATVEVKAEISDAAPTPPPDNPNAQPVATPKTCPIPYPGTGNGAASSGAAPEPRQPDPAPRAAPEVLQGRLVHRRSDPHHSRHDPQAGVVAVSGSVLSQPRGAPALACAAPLPHLRLRGYCTHSCSRLLSRTQGNRCLGLCLRPIMAGERAGHTQHVCHNCRTGR